MKDLLIVYIDDREPKKLFRNVEYWNETDKFNFTIKKKRLPVCDMVFRNKRIGIEYKRFETCDPIKSIIDGRHPKQIINMKNSNLNQYIYIFIGEASEMFDIIKEESIDSKQMNNLISSYYGFLASIQTKYGANVNHAPTEKHAVLLSFLIFRHSMIKPKDDVVFRIDKKLVDEKSRKIASLTCIKGVGEASAKKILGVYDIPVLKNIKDPLLLKEKANIGISKANNIIKYFNG